MSLCGLPMSTIVGLMFVLLPSLRRVLPKCPIKPSLWPPSSSSSAPSSSPSAHCSWLDTLESPRFLHRSFSTWTPCCLSVRRCCWSFSALGSNRACPHHWDPGLPAWLLPPAHRLLCIEGLSRILLRWYSRLWWLKHCTHSLDSAPGAANVENVEMWPIRLDPVKKQTEVVILYQNSWIDNKWNEFFVGIKCNVRQMLACMREKGQI